MYLALDTWSVPIALEGSPQVEQSPRSSGGPLASWSWQQETLSFISYCLPFSLSFPSLIHTVSPKRVTGPWSCSTNGPPDRLLLISSYSISLARMVILPQCLADHCFICSHCLCPSSSTSISLLLPPPPGSGPPSDRCTNARSLECSMYCTEVLFCYRCNECWTSCKSQGSRKRYKAHHQDADTLSQFNFIFLILYHTLVLR